MSRIIACVNQKGGVGKTSTATNLAYALSLLDGPTLLIDFDPSANASKVFCVDIPIEPTIKEVMTIKDFNIENAIMNASYRGKYINNLFIIPSRIQLANIDLSRRAHREKILSKQINKISHVYRYIIIDCPPMLSDFSSNAIYAANFILIPVKYEKDALDGVNDLFDIINEIKEDEPIQYKILRNGLDGRKSGVNSYVDDVINPFIQRGLVFKTIINQDEEINKAKIMDETVLTFSPKSKGAINYIELTKELISD